MKAEKLRRASPELFLPVTTRAAYEGVARQIVELIEKGELEEGDALPGERVLAATMEVSRPTVRLAVSTLADTGVLAVTPGAGGGIVVRSRWVPETISGRPEVELKAEEIFELLEARRTIEPRVAQLAAVRGTSSQLEAMSKALELQADHLDERPKAIQAEMHFHRLLWQAAGNRALESTMTQLFRRLATAIDMGLRTGPDKADAVELNRETLDAVRSGEIEVVESAMDHHMSYLEQIAEETFGRKRIRDVPPFLVAGDDGERARGIDPP